MDSGFSQEAIKVFKALSDPTRYEIMRMLLNCEELGCGEFDSAFHKSKPAMSHHYRVLVNAGLVAYRKDGLRVYYRVEKGQLDRFLPHFFQVHCENDRQAAE
ncbi:MAG: transcriptional regulator [Chloroflexi bacterium B3_Chlor]|nr:MAG: transcriptional regulator [Chloroflexi bacterium B3_Chlor]